MKKEMAMHSDRTRGRLAAVLLTVAVLFLGNDRASAESADTRGALAAMTETHVAYEPAKSLEGRLTITGSTTMGPLLGQLASEFGRLYASPKVRIVVESTGSSLAIREFLMGFSQQRRGDKARDFGHASSGEASILASSRPLTQEERSRFKARYGHEVMELPIAEDAVAIYVHKNNPIGQLTMEQVDAIFSTTRKVGGAQDIRTWDQLGLDGDWQQQPIHVYGRDKQSGTREFFVHVALKDGMLKPEVQEAPGSASELLAIARDPLGIGYAGTGFQSSYVKAVPLAVGEGHQAIMPSPESVADKSYPLRRTLYLYVNQDTRKTFDDPVLQEFLKFINSLQGQQVVAKAQFYPLSKEQLEQNIPMITGPVRAAALPSRRTGSLQ